MKENYIMTIRPFTFDLFHGNIPSDQSFNKWVPGWWYLINGLPISMGNTSNGINWLLAGWFLSKEKPSDIIEDFIMNKNVETLFNSDGQFILVLQNGDGCVELFRDRCSVIPLLYCQNSDSIILSTLYGSIEKFIKNPLRPSQDLLKYWPVFRKTFPPDTPYDDIKGLSAEHSLEIKDGKIKEIPHPLFFPIARKYRTLEQSSKELGAILSRAVEKRVNKAGRIGVLLSGGNDSSLVVALIRKYFTGTINSVFVTFEGNQRDYGVHARQVADRFKTSHLAIQLSPKDYTEQWAKTIKTLQTPVPMPCHVGIDIALKELSGKVDIMVDGDGADTVFGSSLWPQMIALSRWGGIMPMNVRNVFTTLLGFLPRSTPIQKIVGMAKTALNTPIALYPHVNAAMISKKEFVAAFANDGWQWAISERSKFAQGEFFNGFFSYLMLHGIPEDIATSARLAYAHNLIFLYPFLDYELLKESLRLPNRLRYHYRLRKAPLKRYCCEFFDKKFVYKPKEGFGVPFGAWFAKKEFKPFLMMPLEARSLKRGWWNEKTVRELILLHLNGKGNDSSAEALPWIITNLELWYRICIENESPDLYS
jgi:asparagine synthase (glutamine-hydrolysing)